MRNRDSLLMFDLLRLAAAAAVAVGHCWMIYHDNNLLVVGSMRVGRTGVAILCAIGGYFAFLSRTGSSRDWLRRRLARIYPPFWATLALLLILNHWFHQREISLALVVSEFAGIGYFTHGYILGVHLWFISLILVCYCLAAVLRKHTWGIAVVAAPLLLMPADLAELTLCFLLGGATAVTSSAWLPVLGIVCGITLGFEFNPDYRYMAAAGLALLIAHSSSAKSPGWIARAAPKTYEFYLLHPIAYLAFREVVGVSFLVNLVVGTAATIVGVEAMEFGLETASEWTSAIWRLQFRRVGTPDT